MENYINGLTIKNLRKNKNLTQKELADILNVTDKTISKWETGKGYPDSSLIQSLAKAFEVSVLELFDGEQIQNTNQCANLLRSCFYICPICGNIITSVGESVISCHGLVLKPLEASSVELKLEPIEDDYYIEIDSPMTKDHFISFVAGVATDKIQIIKLYPESSSSVRMNRRGLKIIYYYDNVDGFKKCIIKSKK